jgi:LuxR family glucitol operon transcriptional activator
MRPFRVFVSSTYDDLRDHRLEVFNSLSRLDLKPVGMEYFGAEPAKPKQVCDSEIEDCDLFVGIYAHRYGFVPEGDEKSITEQEFDLAQELGKPCFCYLIDEDHPWLPKFIEEEPGKSRLRAFKARIESTLVRGTFATPQELAGKVASDLGKWLVEHGTPIPSIPKVYENLPQRGYGTFVGRRRERAKIRELLSPDSRHFLVTIDGIGGVGKSALALEVAHHYLSEYDCLPPEERFEAIIWTSAKSAVLTADGIAPRRQIARTLDDIYSRIAKVLRREDIIRARPEDQDEHVTTALTQLRTLLIVDNLETVDDERVNAFLRELPAPTKAIVTTRHRIDVAYPIRLKGIPKEDGLDLISQECAKKDVTLTEAEAEKLYDRTGGVPLAIVWSVARMGYSSSVGAVLRRLSQPASDIARFCFEEVVERIRGKDAHKLLMALALFATGARREALGYVAGFEGDEESRDKGLVELFKWSLVNKQGDRFSMLPLTKLYSQHEWQLSEKSKNFVDEATSRWEAYLVELVGSRPSQQYWIEDQEVILKEGEEFRNLVDWAVSREGKEDTALRVMRPAVLSLQYVGRRAEASKLALMGKELAQICGDRPMEAWLSIDIGWILSQQGAEDDALKQIEEGLRVYKELSDVLGVCFAQCFLAQAMRRAKRLTDAKELLEGIVQRASGLGYSEGLSIAKFELGKLARDQNNWEDAYKYFGKAREALSKIDNTFHDIFSLGVHGNYGGAALELGKYLEAKQISLQTLAVLKQWRRDWDIATNFTARMYLQVAEAERSLGNYFEARDYATQALTLLQSLERKEDIDEVKTLLEELERAVEVNVNKTKE